HVGVEHLQSFVGGGFRPDTEPFGAAPGEAADIVQTHDVVGVAVGDQHCIQRLDAETQHLVTEIRADIDDHRGVAVENLNAGPTPDIAGSPLPADPAVTADDRNPVGPAGAQKPEFHYSMRLVAS